MRGFLSSPFRSHAAWNLYGKRAPLADAMRAMLRLHGLQPVFSVLDVPRTDNCVWSPLIEGDAYSAAYLSRYGVEPTECHMLDWCLYQMRHGGFDTNIQTDGGTISRHRDFEGLRTGCDKEKDLALELGHRVVLDSSLVYP